MEPDTMSTQQQGDIIMLDTPDGGEIVIEGGVAKMGGGLVTAAYLSLFTAGGFWGGEYAGETLTAIQNHPLTSSTRLAVQRAAERDLAWMLAERIAETVDVTVALEGRNRLTISVQIDSTTAGPWTVVWEATS